MTDKHKPKSNAERQQKYLQKHKNKEKNRQRALAAYYKKKYLSHSTDLFESVESSLDQSS